MVCWESGISECNWWLVRCWFGQHIFTFECERLVYWIKTKHVFSATYNLSRSDELTTETLDMAMAAAAIHGGRARPKLIKAPGNIIKKTKLF